MLDIELQVMQRLGLDVLPLLVGSQPHGYLLKSDSDYYFAADAGMPFVVTPNQAARFVADQAFRVANAEAVEGVGEEIEAVDADLTKTLEPLEKAAAVTLPTTAPINVPSHACSSLTGQQLAHSAAELVRHMTGGKKPGKGAKLDVVTDNHIGFDVRATRADTGKKGLSIPSKETAGRVDWAQANGVEAHTMVVMVDDAKQTFTLLHRKGIGAANFKEFTEVARVDRITGEVTQLVDKLPWDKEAELDMVPNIRAAAGHISPASWRTPRPEGITLEEMKASEVKYADSKMYDFYDGRESRSAAKHRIATELSKRLVEDEDFREYAAKVSGWQNWAQYAAGRNEDTFVKTGSPIYEAVDRLIRNWAGTSGDDNTESIGLQMVIQEEFGLTDSTVGHVPAATLKRAGKWLDEYDGGRRTAMHKFVRAQYEHTQEWMEKKGIDEILLYRGFYFEEGEDAAKQLAKFFAPGTDNALGEVIMAPASSFAYRMDSSQGFANGGWHKYMIATRVPREMVLGSCQSGYGCKNEAELVVLGARMKATIHKSTSYIYVDDDLRRAMAAASGGNAAEATLPEGAKVFATDVIMSSAAEDAAKAAAEKAALKGAVDDAGHFLDIDSWHEALEGEEKAVMDKWHTYDGWKHLSELSKKDIGDLVGDEVDEMSNFKMALDMAPVYNGPAWRVLSMSPEDIEELKKQATCKFTFDQRGTTDPAHAKGLIAKMKIDNNMPVVLNVKSKTGVQLEWNGKSSLVFRKGTEYYVESSEEVTLGDGTKYVSITLEEIE